MTGVAADLPLIDHHCHGVLRNDSGRPEFEAMLTEADGPGSWHGTLFDTQAGLGVRAVCAPLLDLPRFADSEEYLERRRELGWAEVSRRMLDATGIELYLVDTGFLADQLTSPDELATLGSAAAREIVRLENIAEQVLAETDASHFADSVRDALGQLAPAAAGFKSIAAYRVGLDLDPRRPSDAEVETAAARVGATTRLADETLTRFLIWTALDLGGPVQFHVAYGDADVDLGKCDPLLLTPLLRASTDANAPIMLLHNYPFQRSAGYLAQVFDHVYVDVGLALHNVGTRADAILAELLELAPFGSVLFSSDACALPELYALNTALFRRAMNAYFDDGLTRDYWSTADAERLARMICRDNALRAYGLDQS